MTTPTIALDHLVVAARTLAEGTAYVTHRLGVAPGGGGRHPGMGTHNRVLGLGRSLYLEVIAIDPQAPVPEWPRWFALDDPAVRQRLAQRPRLAAWVARTDSIAQLADAVYDRPATIRPMQRDALRWQFAFTADGSLPGDGMLPYLIQWETAEHPAANMPPSGCRLSELTATHTDRGVLETLRFIADAETPLTVHAAGPENPPGLRAWIRTPNGLALLD